MVVAQKLKEAEITEQDSLLLTRNLLRIAIFNISYIRGLFPEKYFNDKSVPALKMKIKKLMPLDAESRRLIDWMEKGVYDALQKKFLKTLLFCICEDLEGPMIEEYAFSFNYGNLKGEEVSMNVSRSGNKKNGATFKSTATDITPDQMRSSACKMIRTLVQLMRTLDRMPEERTILMKLLYYGDVTPADYEPPFFRCCAENEANTTWIKNPLKMEVGNVNSKHFMLALKVKSILDPCEDENEDLHEDEEVTLGGDSLQDDDSSSSDSEIRLSVGDRYVVASAGGVPIHSKDMRTQDLIVNQKVKDELNISASRAGLLGRFQYPQMGLLHTTPAKIFFDAENLKVPNHPPYLVEMLPIRMLETYRAYFGLKTKICAVGHYKKIRRDSLISAFQKNGIPIRNVPDDVDADKVIQDEILKFVDENKQTGGSIVMMSDDKDFTEILNYSRNRNFRTYYTIHEEYQRSKIYVDSWSERKEESLIWMWDGFIRPSFAHHNIVFARNPEAALQEKIKKGLIIDMRRDRVKIHVEFIKTGWMVYDWLAKIYEKPEVVEKSPMHAYQEMLKKNWIKEKDTSYEWILYSRMIKMGWMAAGVLRNKRTVPGCNGLI